MLYKIISGGQSGADQLGLITARLAKLETGGTAPKNYRTENGSKYDLKHIFNLKEDDSWRYEPRTEKNIIESDATVLLGDINSVGSRLTIKFAVYHKKKYIINPTSSNLINFIKDNNIEILNVAGNRGSKISKSDRFKFGLMLLETFKYFKSLQSL